MYTREALGAGDSSGRTLRRAVDGDPDPDEGDQATTAQASPSALPATHTSPFSQDGQGVGAQRGRLREEAPSGEGGRRLRKGEDGDATDVVVPGCRLQIPWLELWSEDNDKTTTVRQLSSACLYGCPQQSPKTGFTKTLIFAVLFPQIPVTPKSIFSKMALLVYQDTVFSNAFNRFLRARKMAFLSPT